MSESIRHSLNRLYQSAHRLETAVEAQAQSKKVDNAQNARSGGNAPQSDLFSGKDADAHGQNAVNVRILASRLDTAIDKVEQILREGRG